ncbi:MAG: SLBB domain-containing protein [Synergistaceae bacterium]|nr:SLBB domain-containing protein [Synergistaceae bacterium]
MRKKILVLFMTLFLLFILNSCSYASSAAERALRADRFSTVISSGGSSTRSNTQTQNRTGTGQNQNQQNDRQTQINNINKRLIEDLNPEVLSRYPELFDIEPLTSDDIPLTNDEINALFDEILSSQNEVKEEKPKRRRRRRYLDPNYNPQQGTNTNGNYPMVVEEEEEEDKKPKTYQSPINQLFRRIPRYGMSFFRRTQLAYEAMETAPVTQDYRIGVGDEMTLTVWGIPEEGIYDFVVNRDGTASIPRIGTIRIAGYTLTEAERIVRSRLNQYYTGFQMSLATGKLNSIMVYVTGNARRPGAYTISSFSTLVNALLASGGPSLNGSMRKIELKRNGRTVAVFDMYAMLLRGDKTQDVRLQAGDVIYIPPVGALVGIAGEIQTPGIYELNGSTRVEDLLYIIGGFNARTSKNRLQYFRISNNSYVGAFEGDMEQFENFELQDGDIIRLFPIVNISKTATIYGTLMKPGTYAIIPGQTKVADIINRAGGLKPTAADTAEITRVTPTLQGPVSERFTINVADALRGDPAHNIALEDHDQITVMVIPEWRQQAQVKIEGEVKRPGTYSMLPGERLSDLITRAGGFTSRAFLRGAMFTRVSVAEEQKEALEKMADRMEREVLQAMQNLSASSSANKDVLNAEYDRRLDLIDTLRDIDIMGRVITKIDTPQNIIGTEWDYELQDGDVLKIPETPLTVNIMGAVYSSSTHIYHPNMGVNAYINASGGALKNAHKRLVYLLKSDGTTIRLTRNTSMLSSKEWQAPRGYSAKVEPGDTIVVPVKYRDRLSFENVRDTIDVIYKIAVAVGVILDKN